MRHYGERVDVARTDERPARFVWRGRLYRVTDVLGSWSEAGRWWRAAAATAVLAGDVAGGSVGGAPFGGGFAPDDRERECWRVAASAGRCGATGVYDLCFDWSAGTWLLLRVLD